MIELLEDKAMYPLHYFPSVFIEAINAISRDVQAPIELIGSVVLSAASLACQGLVKIRYQDGRVTPCSLYNIVIADSGERKSAVYSLVMKPFLNFEKEAKKKYELFTVDYNAELQSWKVQEQAILKCIRKGTEIGDDIKSDDFRLKEHYRLKPVPPVYPKMIYNDVTPEALQFGLYNNVASASLMSDEAGVFFKGRAKNNLSFLNQLWDGSSFDVERKSGSFSVDGCQFTMLLMIQSQEFSQYIKRQGDHAIGSGFLARFMLTSVTSTQGQRNGRIAYNAGGESLGRFHQRIEYLLRLFEERQCSGIDHHEYLTLSTSAQNTIEKHIANIESRIIKDKDKNPVVEGVLSKIPDNMVRIAALFHYFCGDDGYEITADYINMAAYIMRFFYQQTINSLSRYSGRVEDNADSLYQWLCKIKNMSGITSINKMEVRRKGPFHLRSTYRLNAAILFLEQEGKLKIVKHYNRNGSVTQMIDVM